MELELLLEDFRPGSQSQSREKQISQHKIAGREKEKIINLRVILRLLP